MKKFLIKELKTDNLLRELNDIEYDRSYAAQMSDKFRYKNYKIFGLTAAQANILKQLALSVGADCATPRNTITGMIDSADCILGGSISQLQKISVKLGIQPFGLRKLGRQIEQCIANDNANSETKIMGILNVSPDSFSDGGLYENFEDAVKHLHKLIDDGADIIDIGAESTKPFSKPVSPAKQLHKLIPVLDYIRDNKIDIPVSIDTRSAKVAAKCLDAGATAINDVSGLTFDDKMAEILADYECPVVIQHSKGDPEIMQINPVYSNLMDEIFTDLDNKISYALSKGIKKENIIIDPGIGFGKTRENNFEIIRRIGELKTLDYPVLIGLSRKSLLNMPDADNDTKDIFSVALNAIAVENKVDIIRVHNVKLHRMLLDMLS
ncbi:dihydropteroate synthase [bacterium]|nr:dihydropteroate synthase [bacterium]